MKIKIPDTFIKMPKFRFWNHIVYRMSSVYTLAELQTQEILWTNVIPLQYLGKLKNGQKAFVGDVIKHGESIRFLEIRNGNVCATTLNLSGSILLSFCEKPEVIGNLFENADKFKIQKAEENGNDKATEG